MQMQLAHIFPTFQPIQLLTAILVCTKDIEEHWQKMSFECNQTLFFIFCEGVKRLTASNTGTAVDLPMGRKTGVPVKPLKHGRD